jgi:pilus assembly protein Flp/PilA
MIKHFISTLLAYIPQREDEEGQTLVEYGLLLALIAIIVIVALLFLGPVVSQIFTNVGENLEGAGA